MDDILKRLGHVETTVSEIRTEVSAISAVIPHLARETALSEVRATIPHLATKADLKSMETVIIKWIIATVLASAALAFTVARFVH